MHVTDVEYQARKVKRLYFSCNEKFTLGHQCKKELLIMIVAEGEDFKDVEDVTFMPIISLIHPPNETIKLSLNSVLVFPHRVQ